MTIWTLQWRYLISLPWKFATFDTLNLEGFTPSAISDRYPTGFSRSLPCRVNRGSHLSKTNNLRPNSKSAQLAKSKPQHGGGGGEVGDSNPTFGFCPNAQKLDWSTNTKYDFNILRYDILGTTTKFDFRCPSWYGSYGSTLIYYQYNHILEKHRGEVALQASFFVSTTHLLSLQP